MKKRILLLTLVISGLTMIGCVAVPPAQREADRRERMVTMPLNPDMRERQYLPEVASVLEDADFSPVLDGGVPNELQFDIDEGPINTVVTARLIRRGQVFASAEGRDGGPRSLIDRAGVVRSAVGRCLRDFSDQLERAFEWEAGRANYSAPQQGYYR